MKNSRYDSNVCHAKRTFDVLVALLILLITAPLFPFIALAIKVSSKGPVIYRQLRVGRCTLFGAIRIIFFANPKTGLIPISGATFFSKTKKEVEFKK